MASDAGPQTQVVGAGFVSEPNLFAIADESYEYGARVSEPGANSVEYQLLIAPEGMRINAALGDLSWVPSTSQGGAHAVVIQASVDGMLLEQSYQLQVGVARVAAEAEIGSEGGELAAGDLVVTIPPGAVDLPTGFQLWVLEEGLPPLWQEMHLVGTPFVLRSTGSIAKVPVILRTRAELPTGAKGYLARGARESSGKKNASKVEVVVVNETTDGPSADQITADLTAVSEEYVDLSAPWFAFTYLFAEIFEADGFRVVWAYNEVVLESVAERASQILSAFADAKAAATGSMGCNVQDELVVYVATFQSGTNTLGIAWDQKVFLSKVAVRESSTLATRDTIAHEYFHTIQGHILGGADSGWIAEPTAEFAAGQIFNANLSHTSFGPMDEEVTLLGFAEKAGEAVDLHQYQLYIYFRYLHETAGWRVCDFYQSQAAILSNPSGAYASMSAHLGSVDFSQSYLDFTEAYLFARDSANFGDDAAGIGDWQPSSLDFSAAPVSYEQAAVHGGTGVKINRSSSEPQNIAVELSGSLYEGTSLPLAVLRDQSGTELVSLVGVDQKAVVLKDVSSPSFTIALAQGLMDAHPNANTVTISVSEFDIVIANQSGMQTDENGAAISFDVSLSASPGELSFVVDIASNDATEGRVDTAALTFTKDTWDTPQTIRVIGLNDSVSDGDVNYAVDLSVSSPADWDMSTTLDLVNVEPLPLVSFDINTQLRGFPATRTTVIEGTYPDNPNYTNNPLASGTIQATTDAADASYTSTITNANWTVDLVSSHSSHSAVSNKAYTGAAALPYSLDITNNTSTTVAVDVKVNGEIYGSLAPMTTVTSLTKSASQPEWAGPYSALQQDYTASEYRITRVRGYSLAAKQLVRFYVTKTETSETHTLSTGYSYDHVRETTTTTYEEVLQTNSSGAVVQSTENIVVTPASNIENRQIDYRYYMLDTDTDIDGLPGNYSGTSLSTNRSSDTFVRAYMP